MKWFIIPLLAGLTFGVHAQSENKDALDDKQTGLNLNWLDSHYSPQQDFYMYANGGWKAHNPIPKEYSSWGAFSMLQEKNLKAIHAMLRELSSDPQKKEGSLEQKAGDFYYSGMDESTINKLKVSPLKSEFAKIEAIQSLQELQTEFEHLHQYGINSGFSFQSMQDFTDSTEMIAAVVQSGLSLPDRDYYLKTDKKFVDIRSAFLKHMQVMLHLLGDTVKTARREAHVVMRIETALAKGSMSRIEQRDPHAIYHLMDVKELSQVSGHFNWPAYFQAMGHPEIEHLNVGMPNFLRTFDQLLGSEPIEDWKVYLKWHLLNDLSPFLSKEFVQQNFKMNSILTGVQSLPPRWKQVVATESGVLGFAIGELYVQKYFSAVAKQQVMDMIDHIRQILRKDLEQLQWMSKNTRKAAIRKLDQMEERVGYPDKWWDYSSLKIDRGPYVLNVLRGAAFITHHELNKIGKPVDRTEWAMTPQTVNAYYDPSMNNINIPMGILQPPYFDINAPLAVNYGGIGMVIGHEITHGFDDEGAKFDDQGNLHNWWTDEDLRKFKSATQCIVDQFSHYTVNGNIPIQGELVVGEATADLGGLSLAYRAFQSTGQYAQQPTLNGFTPDQQFFLSFAHVWANNIRPEQAHNLILVDPHPPAQYRVNGTLANFPSFHTQFQVIPPSLMVNAKPCVIW